MPTKEGNRNIMTPATHCVIRCMKYTNTNTNTKYTNTNTNTKYTNTNTNTNTKYTKERNRGMTTAPHRTA